MGALVWVLVWVWVGVGEGCTCSKCKGVGVWGVSMCVQVCGWVGDIKYENTRFQAQGPFPTEKEPSDHVLIAADLVI